MKKKNREVEKIYSNKQSAQKLRRLASALAKGRPFLIQIAKERITVPAKTQLIIEHEREKGEEEIEIQLKWKSPKK